MQADQTPHVTGRGCRFLSRGKRRLVTLLTAALRDEKAADSLGLAGVWGGQAGAAQGWGVSPAVHGRGWRTALSPETDESTEQGDPLAERDVAHVSGARAGASRSLSAASVLDPSAWSCPLMSLRVHRGYVPTPGCHEFSQRHQGEGGRWDVAGGRARRLITHLVTHQALLGRFLRAANFKREGRGRGNT